MTPEEQRDADAALGAAWRRAEAAAETDDLELSSWWDGEARWYSARCASVSNMDGDESAAAALDALTHAIADRAPQSPPIVVGGLLIGAAIAIRVAR